MPELRFGPVADNEGGRGRKTNRRIARRAARRRQQRIRRLLVGIVGGVLVAAVILIVTLTRDDISPEPSLEVAIEGRDFRFGPDPARALVGDVRITMENKGSTGHELVVLREGVRLSQPAQFDESMSLGGIQSIARGITASVSVPLTAGTYQLVCLLPGHLESGMESDLIVS
jgi:plastocyanin